ncbi:hypothetical protein C8R47DRAFT_1209145 [Mycena vitilis]|nr:hypothetical protein C8R47DRAFT_1209145 [Mycena vitilis]
MLSQAPLDVLLLILRLLTIKDAIALFATCRSLCLVECRAFWMCANLDLDLLPCALGRPSIDYRTLSTPLLRSRVVKAWSILTAWRKKMLEPRHVRVIPVEWGIECFVCIPWTRVMVVLVDNELFLQNWSSGVRSPVPLLQDKRVLSMKVFRRDSEPKCILVVHSVGLPELGDYLQLFSVDPGRMSVSFLTSVIIPHSVSGTDLRGDHLAVLGYTAAPRSSVIRSFRLVFVPNCSVYLRAVLQFKAPVNYGETSFAIVDDDQLLLVSPRRIEVHTLSTAASFQSHGGCTVGLCCTFSHDYSNPDILSRPPLGPILTRTDGAISFSTSSGAHMRSFFMTPVKTPGRPDSYTVIEKRVSDEVPVHFGVSTGFRIAVFRLPYSTSPAFTTFTTWPVPNGKDSLYPFFYEGDHPKRAKGSVVFVPGANDVFVFGTLRVDEEQGRIMFIVQSFSDLTAKIIVLELNWRSGAISAGSFPLLPTPNTPVFSAKLFWNACLASYVLVTVQRGKLTDAGMSFIVKLFLVNSGSASAEYLTSVSIPHSISSIDMRGDQMAVFGHKLSSVCYVHSFVFHADSSLHLRAVIRLRSPRYSLGTTSFAVLDDKRFIAAGPKGVYLYRIPTKALLSPGHVPTYARPVWYLADIRLAALQGNLEDVKADGSIEKPPSNCAGLHVAVSHGMGPQERNGRDHPIRNHIARTYGETPANRAAERASLQRRREDKVRSTGGVVIDGGSASTWATSKLLMRLSEIRVSFLWHDAFTATRCLKKNSMLESASMYSEETAELLCPTEEGGEQLPPQITPGPGPYQQRLVATFHHHDVDHADDLYTPLTRACLEELSCVP